MARKLSSDNPIERQKAYAERIDHQYFLRPHPWRTWMRRLSWSLPLAGVGVLAWLSLQPRGQELFLPGAISSPHSIFGHRCGECHEQTRGQWGAVKDTKCIACHDAPIHSAQTLHASGNIQEQVIDGKVVKVSTPNCSTCHAEHRGNTALTHSNDAGCIQCHSDLKRADGKEPTVKAKITSFESKHPEFAVLRDMQVDTTPFKLNHALHLDPAQVTWPADVVAGAKENVAVLCIQCHEPDQSRTSFKPISYEKHCASCHSMEKIASAVDPIGKVSFTHAAPAKVATEIRSAVANYLIQHGGSPAALSKLETKSAAKDDDDLDEKKSVKPADAKVDLRTSEQWVHDHYSQMIQPLFSPENGEKTKKSCLKCHIPEGVDENGLLKISAQKIPTVWLKKSVFNHNAHRALDCLACHTQAPNSQFTGDVLLPGIANCRTCHSSKGGAQSRCTECHLYHDRELLKPQGRRSVADLEEGLGNQPDLSLIKPRMPAVYEAMRRQFDESESARRQQLRAEWDSWQAKQKQELDKRAAAERARLTPPVTETKTTPVQPAPIPPVAQPVPQPAAVPAVTLQPPQSRPKIETPLSCPNCKMRWPADAKFCGRCGIRMNVAP
ncbi:MAG TPA: cytochrome c3 family protein [Planctomycetota bacterium]|nr:cytochrome c3 family protein [Planctomycetota bacterium]